eukprot:scaffold47_cov258-Pinguiococcus_pyrenoidosus.AAC.130
MLPFAGRHVQPPQLVGLSAVDGAALDGDAVHIQAVSHRVTAAAAGAVVAGPSTAEEIDIAPNGRHARSWNTALVLGDGNVAESRALKSSGCRKTSPRVVGRGLRGGLDRRRRFALRPSRLHPQAEMVDGAGLQVSDDREALVIRHPVRLFKTLADVGNCVFILKGRRRLQQQINGSTQSDRPRQGWASLLFGQRRRPSRGTSFIESAALPGTCQGGVVGVWRRTPVEVLVKCWHASGVARVEAGGDAVADGGDLASRGGKFSPVGIEVGQWSRESGSSAGRTQQGAATTTMGTAVIRGASAASASNHGHEVSIAPQKRRATAAAATVRTADTRPTIASEPGATISSTVGCGASSPGADRNAEDIANGGQQGCLQEASGAAASFRGGPTSSGAPESEDDIAAGGGLRHGEVLSSRVARALVRVGEERDSARGEHLQDGQTVSAVAVDTQTSHGHASDVVGEIRTIRIATASRGGVAEDGVGKIQLSVEAAVFPEERVWRRRRCLYRACLAPVRRDFGKRAVDRARLEVVQRVRFKPVDENFHGLGGANRARCLSKRLFS